MGLFSSKSSSASTTNVNNAQVTAPVTLGVSDNASATNVSGRVNGNVTLTDQGAVAGSLALAENTFLATVDLLDQTATQSRETLAGALNLVDPTLKQDTFAEANKLAAQSRQTLLIMGGGLAAVYLFTRK